MDNFGWTPIQSNPEVLTSYLRKLGVSEDWSIVDVLGFDVELIALVPKPVKALLLLFPYSAKHEEHRRYEEEQLKKSVPEYPKDLFFMKQTIPNACGTCALIHAVSNDADIAVEDGILKKFLDSARPLTPEERGKLLEGSATFTAAHNTTAEEGLSENPSEGENHHFVALIEKDSTLYELDGLKSWPIKHGPTSKENFLLDAARVCKEFIARDPDEIRFTVGALAATQKE